ncbi:MAG: hypothetical protein VR64_07065 [Desulfatitalea sp. BRH_c12]|nr:MAG: hypothetical protein VR64_07065 [Desulfatitalea sp. BRH_c12]
MVRFLVLGLVVAGIVCGAVQVFSAVSPGDIPPDLTPWQAWVLHGRQASLCPSQYNDSAIVRCQWPSRLRLTVSSGGAEFEQHWSVFAEGWVVLPGGAELWPESVTADGRPVAVIQRDNVPAVHLGAGEHRIVGRFTWSRLPEMIPVPPASGLFSLVIDDQPIAAPSIDEHGRLWLQEGPAAESGAEAVTVQVFRLLDDTIPMLVHTLLRLEVSGKPREIVLNDALLSGAIPMSLDSPLPARIQPDGRLTLQARAGRWEVRIAARLAGPQSKIPAGAAPYGEEIWSFQPRHDLRMVEIMDVPAVAPGRTEMPMAWRDLPAYVMQAGSSMTIKEIRRGDPDPAPDQLSLQRTWWLDFDGGGFTVHDEIDGTLSRQWYLAMNPPMQLGRVAVAGEERVITEQGPEKKRGVELRRGRMALQADARLPQRVSVMSAVGWEHDFQSVGGVLHLPPGWRLLAASGIDQVSDTWVQRWSLLDFFLILIIALAVFKLRTWLWGLVALGTMVLIFQEPGAPRLVWLHLLAVLALLPVLPAGWLRRLVGAWGIGAVVVLLVTAVPFVVQQLRWGVYPQLAHPGGDYRPFQEMAFEPQSKPSAPAEAMRGGDARSKTLLAKPIQDSMAATVQPKTALRQQDPDALIPTGPGLPDWRWQSVDLRWSGPVAKDQPMTLYLLSPILNLILALLRVGLLALLVVALIDWRPWWQKMRAHLQAGAVGIVLMGICWAGPGLAVAGNAVFPPQPLLDELRQRLLEKSDCYPECADISHMELLAGPSFLQVKLRVNCAERVAVPLPVHRKSWVPEQILLDNAPIGALTRDDGGQLWALVPAGLHTVVLLGAIGPESALQIPLPLKPHTAAYSAQGWRVTGIHPDGSVAAGIQLTRLASNEDNGAAVKPTHDLPPFLQVERVLHLGLSWQTTTTVRRLTPVGSPVSVTIPLLADESVTTAGIETAQGEALITLAPDQQTVTYAATLPIGERIVLEAPRAVPWSETWVLDAGEIWHCDLEGIPVVHHQDGAGQWQPRWQPWPGERATIRIHRPAAVAGQIKTIDRADLVLTPGQRFGQGTLDLSIRTSRGGQHTLALPPQANLQQVTVDGRTLPIRQEDRKVTVPLQPGAQQVHLQWQQLAPYTAVFKSPAVEVGQEAVNARVTVHMPAQRWILMTGGPRWGPAVLFWSYLAAIVLAAVGLGRVAPSPLKTWQWVLLGLGLTQIPAPLALVIVGWLVALGVRERQSMPRHWFAFDAVQILLVVWTVVALIALFEAVRAGLLGQPEMQIAGNQSTYMTLHWTQDHIDRIMPQPWVLSLPVWVFRILMLAWSLWLAWSLLGWLKWAWRSLGKGGGWRKVVLRRRKDAVVDGLNR